MLSTPNHQPSTLNACLSPLQGWKDDSVTVQGSCEDWVLDGPAAGGAGLQWWALKRLRRSHPGPGPHSTGLGTHPFLAALRACEWGTPDPLLAVPGKGRRSYARSGLVVGYSKKQVIGC